LQGFELTGPELADWMLRLQDEGRCHNINFVTPEHCAPQVSSTLCFKHCTQATLQGGDAPAQQQFACMVLSLPCELFAVWVRRT
jgi:hypothetical protein